MDDKDEIISKPKKDNNQLKGGEAVLGVLKDEEEKKRKKWNKNCVKKKNSKNLIQI